MISFAGVYLNSTDGPLATQLEGLLSPADLYDFTRVVYPGEPLASLGVSSFSRQRPPKLGRLYWPQSASRFAVGYFIVTNNELSLIRQNVYTSSGGSVSTPQPFILNDGKRSLTTNLWMLAPRPITQIQGNNDGWLLTLVDDRYWWWQTNSNITVNLGTTNWTDLYSSIGTALGVTITVDTVPSAYVQPPDDFTVGYDYLPPLLDAVARSVGQRIVRAFDGSVRAWNAVNSGNQVSANLTASSSTNQPLAGGLLQTHGTTNEDNAAILPKSVTVVFPRSDGGTPLQGACTTVVQTLTSLNLGGDLTGIAGTPWTKLIRTSLVAKYTPAGSQAQNATELSAYAKQAATDFYQWAVSPLDAVYSGVLNWIPEGMDDLEFFHVHEMIYTRLQRPAWQREDTIQLAYGSAGSLNVATVDRTGFDAKITGQPDATKPLYSFTEYVDDGTGSAWQMANVGQTGTGNAFELNKNTSVPVGTFVRMRKRVRTRDFFEFSYHTVQATLAPSPVFMPLWGAKDLLSHQNNWVFIQSMVVPAGKWNIIGQVQASFNVSNVQQGQYIIAALTADIVPPLPHGFLLAGSSPSTIGVVVAPQQQLNNIPGFNSIYSAPMNGYIDCVQNTTITLQAQLVNINNFGVSYATFGDGGYSPNIVSNASASSFVFATPIPDIM